MRGSATNGQLYQKGVRSLMIVALVLCAAAMGVGIIITGGTSVTILLALTVVTLAGLAGLIGVSLDLPVMSGVRLGFALSFFIKADLSLLKVDEIEDPSGLNLSATVLLAVVLILHDLFFEHRTTPILPRYFWILLAGLAIVACSSVIVADTGPLGWYSLFSLAGSIAITVAVASHFRDRDRLIQLIGAIAVGIAVTGLTAISQYVIEFPKNLPNLGTGTEEELLGTQSESLGRVPAFLRTPTEMAFVLSSLLPLIVAPLVVRVQEIVNWNKLFVVAASLLGSAAVILSLARGSWIGLIVGLVVTVALAFRWVPRPQRSRYAVRVGFSVILAGAILLPFGPRIYERLTGDDEGSAEIRIPLMENALRLIEQNPTTGVGLNGYRSHMTKYDDTGIFVSQVFPNPVHNVFAHITAEIGIVGGILFCLLILVAAFECLRAVGMRDRIASITAIGVIAGLIAFVITAMKEPGSLGSVRPPIRTLFLMLGIAMAIASIRRVQADNENGGRPWR